MRQTATPMATVKVRNMPEAPVNAIHAPEPAPAIDRPLAVGDIVRLKSGGPAMTVVSPQAENRYKFTGCCWFIGGGELRRDAFDSDELERCEADVFLGQTDILEIAPGDILVARVAAGHRSYATHMLTRVLGRAKVHGVTVIALEPGENLSVIRKVDGEEQVG